MHRPAAQDFQGDEIGIGDTVVFVLNPFQLSKGMVTGIRTINPRLMMVDIVAGPDNHQFSAIPGLCCKLS